MERTKAKAFHLWLVRADVPVEAAPRRDESGLRRALALMEAGLSERWTVSALARKAGMSRPVFARRFQAAFGSSPLRYLTARRMERARELLVDSELPLAAIAERVGYASQFAFNRAFKRHFLVPPGVYRRAVGMRGEAPRMAA
jgi:transcriptional regulator GlxA family with amidase domain